MENGIGEASREIRTGNFQKGGFSAAEFKQSVCDELLDLLKCDDNLYIDVRRFNSFSSSTNDDPVNDEGEFEDDDFKFEPGGPDEIIVVRIFYKWDLFTPVLSLPLKDLKDGEHLLRASVAFRNEPFGQTNGGGNSSTSGSSSSGSGSTSGGGGNTTGGGGNTSGGGGGNRNGNGNGNGNKK